MKSTNDTVPRHADADADEVSAWPLTMLGDIREGNTTLWEEAGRAHTIIIARVRRVCIFARAVRVETEQLLKGSVAPTRVEVPDTWHFRRADLRRGQRLLLLLDRSRDRLAAVGRLSAMPLVARDGREYALAQLLVLGYLKGFSYVPMARKGWYAVPVHELVSRIRDVADTPVRSRASPPICERSPL